MRCPNCDGEMERDEVDNGVGWQPVGPWGCPACHYVEDRGDSLSQPSPIAPKPVGTKKEPT